MKKRIFLYCSYILLIKSNLLAYDPDVTHPFMAKESIILLKKYSPANYSEVTEPANVLSALQKGVHDEDSITWLSRAGTGWRGVFHFYDPYHPVGKQGMYAQLPVGTLSGLIDAPYLALFADIRESIRTGYVTFNFPNAKDIALSPQRVNLSSRSMWDDAQLSYRDGVLQGDSQKKLKAFEILGHVMHLLVQDMSQPSHTHNDPHTYTIVGGDLETIEIRGAERSGKKSNFPKGEILQGSGLKTPGEFAEIVAHATHERLVPVLKWSGFTHLFNSMKNFTKALQIFDIALM